MTEIIEKDSQLHSLLASGAAEAKAWLNGVLQGTRSAPADFNWLALADVAAQQAREPGPDAALQLAWADISIMVRENLACRRTPPDESLLREAMMVRADMIVRHGHRPGDPVRDANRIIRWFLDRTKVTPREAVELSKDPANLPVERLRMLRRLKNRLAVVRHLAERTDLTLPETLRPWLRIRDQLP